MSFHPPVRPAPPKVQASKSWYEQILEKDELLLYITAILGVVLPGIVYLIYQKVHKIYIKYAEKKMEQERIERIAKNKIAVISLISENSELKKFSENVDNIFKEHSELDYQVWSINDMKASELAEFKGICVFIVETINGNPTDESQWFLEWLEDVAADKKLKKKTNFESIRFCIVGFGSSVEKENAFNKAARTLQKRLKILGGTQFMPMELIDTENKMPPVRERHMKPGEPVRPHDSNEDRLECWVGELLEILGNNLEIGSDNEGDLSQWEQSDEDLDNSTDDEDIPERNKKIR